MSIRRKSRAAVSARIDRLPPGRGRLRGAIRRAREHPREPEPGQREFGRRPDRLVPRDGLPERDLRLVEPACERQRLPRSRDSDPVKYAVLIPPPPGTSVYGRSSSASRPAALSSSNASAIESSIRITGARGRPYWPGSSATSRR